mmetsp:Transcript_9726/g.31183  ORF Transcript_9726/g.31183 Transcript_9726/m.31183 type:complete len:233 (+) Transcript_9726:2962-3660(+)
MTTALCGASYEIPASVNRDDALCELVCRGGVAATCAPISRWGSSIGSLEECNPAAAYGAFSRHQVCFDVAAFGISPMESRVMDPQMALLLETGYAALYDSTEGEDDCRASLMHACIGVFLGIGGTTANDGAVAASMRPGARDTSVYSGTSSALSIASGRISYTFGLIGPCLSLDTACSSSLVATHLAAAALKSAECTRALAIAASLMAWSSTHAFAAAGMLSMLGRCHTFDG